MKLNPFLILSLACFAALLPAGCSSTGGKTYAGPDGILYQHHTDLQKVWLAEGFDFTGYDALYIAPTQFEGVERDNEIEIRTWAIQYLPQAIAGTLRNTPVFASVVTEPSAFNERGRVLTLETTIIEYQKGGGAARYFAGLYGAGQPIIRVDGRMKHDGRPLFMFEARRSGDSGLDRVFGGFISDEDVQKRDIDDLAQDLAEFITQTAQGGR